MLSLMVAFRATADLPHGSRPISSASKMAVSPSTGMSCKTKRPKPNPGAGCQCLVTAFPADN